MRFIPTRTHGMLDYLMGILLLIAPWVFGFAQGGAETWVPVILGAGVLLYSLFTNYEMGAVHLLGMRTHLALDATGGLLLALSPWLFGFAGVVWVPHLLLGLIEISAAAFTRRVPGSARPEGPSRQRATG